MVSDNLVTSCGAEALHGVGLVRMSRIWVREIMKLQKS
jgi:hypothetical protein